MPKALFKGRRLMLGGFVAALAVVFLVWPRPKGGPPPTLPSPNGYDALMSAAGKLPRVEGYYKDWPHDRLANYVRTNAAILDEAHLGLSRRCQVPFEYSATYFSRHLPELSNVKLLEKFFAAAGRLAELEHRPTDSAKNYLDSIRLGQQSARGGFMIDLLVGTGCESSALRKLDQLVDELDAKSANETLRTLSELDTNRPSIEAAISLDREWDHRFGSFRERLAERWTWKSLDPTRKSAQKAISKFNATIRQHRLLMLKLAARAYELEQGRKPASVGQLVPELLHSIPKDPESGTSLSLDQVFRRIDSPC